jgi:hypothetical protein
MRKSKFVGMQNGIWECVRCVTASIQGRYCAFKRTADNKKAKAKHPGSRNYEYLWRRLTSDGKAYKYITLTAAQTNKILRGLATVEEYAQKKEAKRSFEHIERVSYCFCD